MKRVVEPEWLDSLSPQEPRAAASRNDLRRLNTWMGHAPLLVRALRPAYPQGAARLIELGAGDGSFLLQVARRLAPGWPATRALLLDQQDLVTLETRSAFARLGWHTDILQADVFAWLQSPDGQPCEVILANLFLHHFTQGQLAQLLPGLARRTRAFIALEPRRAGRALFLSRLVGLLGCNPVTRHDAPVSVRAGFAGQELSGLWPADQGWSMREEPAGWVSHLFIAQCQS